ncbi:pre-rRNA-processing protein TSR2 [Kwoniella mangroviensis CBS 10435]|uniref:Pre-rRNA-processing protein TSR2 n=1 Tax=Kwoniella mangroviensis CBS 10435 TaxID=1331196 RepID=A0A1B9IV79_9TREE|nr:pre-rRNA-processing protein TSR2 [Kwoniella mangroviensis CBS 8507]OCF59436.1 pre-rRNA-processing protein TSR2 [Kwoniella mangroviensis CBS 10435]OCF66401.1 pre-rRNA-processing protein TSR2 [Kwoniella mangroviensis CBS 8507]
MSAQPQQPEAIILFARGTLALLDLWPALTIAVAEQWGGTESAAKKTWLASILIDEFETRAPLLPIANAGDLPVVDPKSANDPPLDVDEVADLLHQIMSDEFDANLEDGSIDSVSSDLIKLWKDILGPNPLVLVEALERKAGEMKKMGVNAARGAGGAESQSEGEDSDDHEDEDGDIEMDGQDAPQLVDNQSQQSRERQEPVVDDDGFTLVQKRGGRR